MDWLTGQWSEFDDEEVTLLKQTPKLIYTNRDQVDMRYGNSQIYKCFYVKQSFLKEKVLKQLDMIRNGDINKFYQDHHNILQKKSK